MPPDRHGPAARPRGRQRARDPRGARHVRGDGPVDFTELVLDACARLLAYSDLGIDVDEGRRRAEAAIADGSALERLRAVDPCPGRRPRPRGARAGAGASSGARAAGRRRDAGRRAGRRASRRSSSGRAGGEGRPGRPRGRRPLLREAGRHRARGRRPRGGARAGRRVGRASRAAVLAAYELGDEAPRRARDPARRDDLSRLRRRAQARRARRRARERRQLA